MEKCLKSRCLVLERIKIIWTLFLMGKPFWNSNKSLFEQPSEEDWVRKPRFGCIYFGKKYSSYQYIEKMHILFFNLGLARLQAQLIGL